MLNGERKLIEKAKKEKIELVYDRYEKQKPLCNFGLNGSCCKNCHQGPCRTIPRKCDKGVCGINTNGVIARNLVRIAAAGASCHADHAREMLIALYKIAEKNHDHYSIKDIKKLKFLANKLGIKSGSKQIIAKKLVLEGLEDFRRQEGLYHKQEGEYLNWLKIRANKKLIKKWEKLNILPVNSDLETSHALHQTTMGNDADPDHLLLSVLRLGLVDGYSGLVLGSDISDIIFGVPHLVKSTTNFGSLKKDYVNIIVHGHIPLLAEKILSKSKELEKEAIKVGAKGINIVGMCCSGSELLMREGVPFIGHLLQQELVIVTGIADAVVVDIQCIYPSLQDIASCYHTKLITTIDFVRIPGALHVPFKVEDADNSSALIVREGIKAYTKRGTKIFIPSEKNEVIAGFSVECIKNLLSKIEDKPWKVLADYLKKKKLNGIVAIVGCTNPKVDSDFHYELSKLLLNNNILIIGTGCWSHVAAQNGLMNMNALQYCGSGLKEFLKILGEKNKLEIPPCWHMGSCVDCGRIGVFFSEFAEYLNKDLSSLPIVVSSPAYATEKAFSIAMYFLAMGLNVHINPIPPIYGSTEINKFLTNDIENLIGSKILLGDTPEKAFNEIINILKKKSI